MAEAKPKMTFTVKTRRVDAHGSLAKCKEASITLDTDINGRADAFIDEVDRRLELLHDNVKRYGTVFNTVVPGTAMSGTIRRSG